MALQRDDRRDEQNEVRIYEVFYSPLLLRHSHWSLFFAFIVHSYCATVFTMSGDQHLHIPQGCLHAFRKMTTDPLPQHDCHYNIRATLVEQNGLAEKGSPLCVSIAFDW